MENRPRFFRQQTEKINNKLRLSAFDLNSTRSLELPPSCLRSSPNSRIARASTSQPLVELKNERQTKLIGVLYHCRACRTDLWRVLARRRIGIARLWVPPDGWRFLGLLRSDQ